MAVRGRILWEGVLGVAPGPTSVPKLQVEVFDRLDVGEPVLPLAVPGIVPDHSPLV